MTELLNVITLLTFYGPALLSVFLMGFMFISKRGDVTAPNTPNQELIEVAIRAAQGFLVKAHAEGGLLTKPALIADAIGKVDEFLQSNWKETAAKANATSDDLSHIAAGATAEAVKGLVPVLQSELIQVLK